MHLYGSKFVCRNRELGRLQEVGYFSVLQVCPAYYIDI